MASIHTLLSSDIASGKFLGCCSNPLHRCIHTIRIDHLWKAGCTVPVILHCGLLEDGGVFLLNDKDSLARYLLDHGFDVWIPHTRDTFPLPYELLPPDTKTESYHADTIDERTHSIRLEENTCWEWGLDEMGKYDIPAMTEHVFQQTHQQVVFIGHSQGAAACIAAFHFHPTSMQQMVRCVVGLAPAFVAKHQVSPLFENVLYPSLPLLRALPRNTFFGAAFAPVVAVLPKKTQAQLAAMFVKTFFGWDVDEQWNEQGAEGYFACTPTRTSHTLVLEWLERSVAGSKIPYDFGALGKTPLCVFGGKNDALVDTSETTRALFDEAGCNVHCWTELEGYCHMDVLWGKNVSEDMFHLLLHCAGA